MWENENTLHLLKCILDRLESDEYESGGIYTIGGAAGNYALKSPYNTECEFLIVGAYLAATSGNGLVVVTNGNPVTNFTLGTNLGSTASGTDYGNALEGVVLPTSATINSLIAVDHWMPLARSSTVYVLVTGTASYALIALRRKLERYIPEVVRPQPRTHSIPQSRRFSRTLPAESPMVQGFDEQYAGGPHHPYTHSEIPEEQDPANVGRVARRMARYGR